MCLHFMAVFASVQKETKGKKMRDFGLYLRKQLADLLQIWYVVYPDMLSSVYPDMLASAQKIWFCLGYRDY